VGTPKRQEGTLYPRCDLLALCKQQHVGCAERSEALPKHTPRPCVGCGQHRRRMARGAACDAGERGSEELGEGTAVLLEGRAREEDAAMAGRGQLYGDIGQGVVVENLGLVPFPPPARPVLPPSLGAGTDMPACDVTLLLEAASPRPPCSPAPQGGLQHGGDATGKEAACQQLAGGLGMGQLLGQGGQQEEVEDAQQGGLHGQVLCGEERGWS